MKGKIFMGALASLSLFLIASACDIGLGGAVDTEIPTGTISSPGVNAVIRDAFAIKGTWKDDGSVGQVTVALSNTNTKTTRTYNAKVAADGTWICAVDPADSAQPLVDGTYLATVTLYDNGGHTNTVTQSYIIDNTPPVVILSYLKSKDDSATEIKTYGKLFTLSGKAADDNNINRIDVKVYQDEACSTELRTITKQNVPAAIEQDVASFGTEEYSAIYGENSTNSQVRYCKVFAYDDAQRYPADGSAQTDNDKLGNCQTSYYFQTTIEKLGYDKYKTNDLYAMFNGTYSNGSQDSSRAVLSSEEISTVKKTLTETAVKVGTFALNPKNNPTFTVIGLNQALPEGETMFDSATSEAKTLYTVTNGDTQSGIPLTITLTPGRDNYAIENSSIKMYLQECSVTGEVISTAEKITIPNENNSTSIKTKPISTQNFAGLKTDKYYRVCVEGADTKGNAVEPDVSGVYAFNLAPLNGVIELNLTKSPEYVSSNDDANAVNKALNVTLKYSYTGSEELKLYREFDVAPAENAEPIGGVTLTKAVDTTYIDPIPVTELSGHTKVYYTLKNESKSSYSRSRYVDISFDNDVPEITSVKTPEPSETSENSFRFEGTASDSASGLNSIEVKIYDASDETKKYTTSLAGTESWSFTVIRNDKFRDAAAPAYGGVFLKDGLKKIEVQAVDGVGLKSALVVKEWHYKSTKPSFELTGYTPVSGAKIDKTVNLLSIDGSFAIGKAFALSGTISDEYGIDTVTCSRGTVTLNDTKTEWTLEENEMPDVGQTATYEYVFTIKDAAGIEYRTKKLTVSIDRKAPKIKEITLPGTKAFGDDSLSGGSYIFKGTAVDESPSIGMKAVRYAITELNASPDSNTVWTDASLSGENWSITKSLGTGTDGSDINTLYEGKYTLHVKAVDNADNESDLTDATKRSFCVDQKAPKVEVKFYKGSLTSHLDPRADGTYIITDGDIANFRFEVIASDANKISKIIVKEASTTGSKSYIDSKSVTLSSSDTALSVFNLDKEKTYNFEFEVEDDSGNNLLTPVISGKKASIKKTVIFDKHKPEIKIMNGENEADRTATAKSYWFTGTGKAYITGTASDVGSGIKKMEISFDNGSNWETIPTSAEWTYQHSLSSIAENTDADDSYHTINVRITDNAGNTNASNGAVYYFRYDSGAPKLTARTDNDSVNATGTVKISGDVYDGANLAANRPVKELTLTATKDGVAYTLPDGSYTRTLPAAGTSLHGNYSYTIDGSKLTEEGLYTFIVTAKDYAGLEISKDVNITFDKTPPKITKLTADVDITSASDNSKDSNGTKWYGKLTHSIIVSANDGTGSGIDKVEWCTALATGSDSGAEWQPLNKKTTGSETCYNGSIIFAENASSGSKLYIRATDKAGNSTKFNTKVSSTDPNSAIDYIVFNIDVTAPALKQGFYTIEGINGIETAGGTAYVNGSKKLTLYGSYEDGQSGIKELKDKFKLKGTSVNPVPEVKYSTGIIGTKTVTELTAAYCTQLTFENYVESNSTKYKYWKAEFTPNVAAGDTAKLTVQGQNHANLSTDEITIVSIVKDTEAPKIVTGNTFFETNSTVNRVYNSNSKYYVNNENQTFTLRGISTDDFVLNTVTLEGENKQIFKKSDGTVVTNSKTASDWRFEGIDLSSLSNGDKVKIYVVVTDMAGNQNVTRDTDGNITGSTDGLFEIVIDSTPPIGKHLQDGKGKDIYFRIGDAKNDDNENVTAGDGKYNEDLDNKAGSKYSADSYGNKKNIEIRGLFDDGNIFDSTKDVSGIKMIYYRVYKKSDYTSSVKNLLAKVTGKTEDEFKSVYKDYKDFAEDIQKNHTGEITPLSSISEKRVFFTNRTFSTSEAQNLTIADSTITDKDGNTKHWAKIKSNYNEKLIGFDEENNYLVLVAEDNVGNIAVDCARLSNGDIYNNFSLNVDTHAPILKNYTSSAEFTNASDSATGKLRNGDVVLTGTVADYLNGATSLTDTVSELKSLTIKVGETDNKIEFKIKSEEETGSIVQNYYIKDTKDTELKNASEDISSYANKLTTNKNASDTLAVRKWKATIPGSYFTGLSGNVVIYAIAEDNAGNEKKETAANIIVDKDSPKVTLNKPSNVIGDKTVNGKITLKGTTEDSYLTVDSGTDKTLVLYYTTKSDATIGDTFTSGDDAATGWKLLDSKQHASSFEFTNIDTTTLAADQIPVFFIVRATDKAGNIGYSNKLELIVDQDTDRPEITIKNLPLVSMTSSGVWAKNNQLFGTVNDDDGISAVYVMRKNPSDAEPSASDEWGDNLLNGGIWQYTIPKDGPGVFYFKVEDNQKPANTYISSSTKTLQSTPKIYDNQSTPNKYGIRGGTTDSRVYLKVDTKKPEIRNVFYKTSDSTTTTMTVSADDISKMLLDSTTPSGWSILTSAGITNYIGGTKSKYLWILYDFLDDNGIKEIETEKIKKDTKEVNGLSTADFTPTENSDPTYRLIKFDLSSLNSGDNKLSLSVKDQADSSSEPKEYTIKIDNTAPAVEIRKPEGNSDQYGSLAVSASGTVSVDYDNVLIQDFFFALTADDEKPSVSSTVWTNVTDCVGLGKWNILFDKNDGEELGLASDGYYHAKKLNEYIKTLYSSEFTGTEDINKPVYLWVYSVDSLGNTDYDSAKKVQFTVYTQADKPTVKIEYPDSTATTLAGMIRISGIAEIRAEKVASVWLKIDPDFDSSFDDDGWESKLTSLNSIYTVEDSGNTDIGRAIKVDGTTSWHYTINAKNEFGKINGVNRKVYVKAYALSNTNKASELKEVTFTINPDKPQIKSAGNSDDNVLILVNKKDPTKKIQYEENMWISGEWYLEGSVRHGAGIYMFTYTEAGATKGIDLINSETLENTGYGNVTLEKRSDVMDDGATAHNWDFKIPVGAAGDDTVGTNEFTIRILDNGSKASDEKTIKIRYDNKVPSGFTAKTISGAISSTNKDFRNSNGKFALSGEIKENEAAGESGVKRIAFYFTREAKADSSSMTKTTYFIDPLITKVKSGATSEPEKFRNNYIDLSASDTGITPGSDGLYWYEVSDVSVADKNITFDSSKLMSESSRELYKLWDGNIRKGGLCKMNNAVYTIKEKTTESGKIKLTLDSAPASADKAYFALAQVIDNTSVETGTTGTYSDSDTMVNQDGDCMQEGLTGVGGNYEWQASINSTNLYDGPVTLHFVYYDKAGNSSHVSYDGMICNNVPRIASVTVKSDYDGSESFTHTDAAGKTVADEDEISTYYPGGSTTVSNVVKAVKAVTGTVIVSSDGKTTGSAYKTLKDKSEIAVEMVGGNGMLHYQYAIGNTAGSNTIKNGEVSDWATGSEDNYEDNYAYVAASHIHSIELPVTFFTESGKEVPNNTASNPITWFQYRIWDDTDGTTKFVDSQNVIIQIALDVQVTDAIKPNVVIDKFKWNSTRDNSLYGGSSANGHIELESDLPSGIFTGTSGEYDKDPKVSGKIVLCGYVYDNKRLKNIQIAIPKSDVLTNTTTVAIYDNTTKTWKDSDTEDSKITESDRELGFEKGTMADNGWHFTVSNAKSGGAYFDGSGHKVMWTFEYDTEKVTGIAATDVNVTITANDSASLASTSRTASEVDSDETKHRPSYQMDVVPYVTSVIRDSTRYNENRARSGAVALLRGEGSNKISGFNLGNLTNSSISIVPNKNGSETGTEMTSPALADSDRSITFTVPETAETGYLHVVVNGVAALNNMNGYVDYNTETNAKAFDHNTLTDDRYVHIWRVTNKDTFKGSKNAVYPSMASGSDGTLYASFTNYGESKVYYTKSFTGDEAVSVSKYKGTYNKVANDEIRTKNQNGDNALGIATIFWGYDPPEETSICVGPNDEVNVVFAANYQGGNDASWNNTSGSQAGGLYVYDTHASDMNVQNAQKRTKVYRTELYTYDNELNQFRNARVTRTDNYIYMAYYDRLTGAIKTCIINDTSTGTQPRPDTRAVGLPWITIDGSYDGLDNGSATNGTIYFDEYEYSNGNFYNFTSYNQRGVTYNGTHYGFPTFTYDSYYGQYSVTSDWIPFLNTNYEGGLSRTSGTGESVSITTNPSGYPVVFYMDATTGQPRIARASSVYPNTTSDWHVQGVFASSDVNYRTASDYMTCKIDTDGYLHIAFQNTKGQLVYAKSTNNPSDGTTAYTFGASQVIDDSGMWIDITMNGTTPYISYLSRVNSYEGMKLAFWDSTFDENNDGVAEGGWETMTAAMDQKVTNVRTCIASNAKAYDGNSYTAAIGFCPGLDYRAAFYVGQ